MKKLFFYISISIMSWLYSIQFNNADWDLWHRLTVGKTFFETNSVLKNDFLAYTIRKDMWVDHEWGSGVIFYAFEKTFGDIGLLALKALFIFLIMFLLSKIVELQNVKPDKHLQFFFYFFSFVAMFQGIGGTIRCQLFTFLFFTLWIYILERVRRGEDKLLWTLPATMLIWANVHGGFVSGIGLICMYIAGEFLNGNSVKKYFYALIPTCLITIINPYGFKYWEYIVQATTMARPGIAEWKSSFIGPITKFYPYKLFLISTIGVLVYSLKQSHFNFKKVDKVKYIVMLATLYLSIRHIKHQAFLGIAGCAFLYHDFYLVLDSINSFIIAKLFFLKENSKQSIAKIKDIIVYSLILILGSLMIWVNKPQVILEKYKYPFGSIEFAKINNLKGNLVTMFAWGSYAAWKLYPNVLIAFDGRYEEVYNNREYFMLHNFTFQDNKNWYDIINEYHTDIIIIDSGSKSSAALQMRKEWKKVFSDYVSTVFIRTEDLKPSYKYPTKDYNYYIDTKFDTGINFVGKSGMTK